MGRLLKSCNDSRFICVRERFFRALGHFLKRDKIVSITISDLAEKARVWDSTFYDHFENMDDAIRQYNHYYDEDIRKLREEILGEHLTTKIAIQKMLCFIRKHEDYYSTHLHRQNPVPFFTMAKIFRPVFARGWSNFGRKKFDLGFKIFCGEMFGVIYFWGESENFDESKISEHATRLYSLTQNATRRLF